MIEKSDEVVEEIVGSAIRRFRKNCKTDIPIMVSKPEEILLVPMDATLIEQVLLNLLENVAKHSPSATEIFIEIRKDARRVWLTVAENGDGIRRSCSVCSLTAICRSARWRRPTAAAIWASD